MFEEFKSLIETKCIPLPAQKRWIRRGNLIQTLDKGLSRKLVVVSAPAGFGKTTLTADWVQVVKERDKKVRVGWLSLDDGDDDPASFIWYVLKALDMAGISLDGISQETIRPLQTGSVTTQGFRSVLRDVLHGVSGSGEEVVFVIDDYHVLDGNVFSELFRFLIDHLPENFHLVLVGRTEAPFPLSRLRLEEQVVEIGLDDLRFDLEEAGELLKRAGADYLKDEELIQLEEATEGWAAGLQLAALSLKGKDDPGAFIAGFGGDNQYVMDYLLDEVFAGLPENTRDFLLYTSILTRLNKEVCNILTDRTDSQIVLEDLDRQNLFIVRLDEKRAWFRYHNLFASFLSSRLKRDHPDKLEDLHRKAMGWCEQNGLIEEAVEHALAAQAYEKAADLMGEVSHDLLWVRGQIFTLARWCGQLNLDLLETRPKLMLEYGWAMFMSGTLEVFPEVLSRLEKVGESWPEEELRNEIRGQVLVMLGEQAIFKSDIKKARDYYTQADELLPKEAYFTRGMVYQGRGYIQRLEGEISAAFDNLEKSRTINHQAGNTAGELFTLYDLAELRLMEADLEGALGLYRQMTERMEELGQLNNMVACGAYVGIGRVFYRQNRLAEAEEYLDKGIILGAMSGYSGFVRVGLAAMSEVYRSKGDLKTANDLVERSLKIANLTNTYWVINTVKVIQARALLAQGDLQAVEKWGFLHNAPKTLYVPEYLKFQAICVEARYYLAKDDLSKGKSLLAELEKQAKKAGWKEGLIEIYALQAVIAKRQDKASEVEQLAFEAVKLAGPSNYTRVILDEAEDLDGTLLDLKDHHKDNEFIQELYNQYLADQQQEKDTQEKVGEGDDLDKMESLTRREQEILELMAEGYSNQEIADQLVIAIGTVGKHTSNIFKKLGAANRAMAVLLAKELEII